MKLRLMIFGLACVSVAALHACPSCSASLDNPRMLGMAKGFFYSIFFMLGSLFSVVGLLIYKIVKEARMAQPSARPPV